MQNIHTIVVLNEQQLNMPNGHTIVVIWTPNVVPKWFNGQADGLKYKDLGCDSKINIILKSGNLSTLFFEL